MKKNSLASKKAIVCLVLIILSVLSATKGVEWAKNPQSFNKHMEYLDEKQNDVLALSASSLTASTALTLIPGDAATPIANELAELSTYFIITICALILEKCLLPVTGILFFGLLFPASIICFLIYILSGEISIAHFGFRLITFSIVITLLVPTSVNISKAIDGSFIPSVNTTIEQVEETVDKIENSSESEKFSIAKMLSGVSKGVSNIVDDIKNMTNDFIEAIAIMLVTACLIPVIVLMVFVGAVKIFLEWIINSSVSNVELSNEKKSYN